MGSTENTGNAIGLQSGLDDALSAGVDDSGGAARLDNDTSSGQFSMFASSLNIKIRGKMI